MTIDPVDSRFIDRSAIGIDKLRLVQDASIVALSIDDDPALDELKSRTLSIPDFALWLYGYWGRFRGAFFRTPLRLGAVTSGDEWAKVEAAASVVVDAIVEHAEQLDARHQARKSWRLSGGG